MTPVVEQSSLRAPDLSAHSAATNRSPLGARQTRGGGIGCGSSPS